MNNIKELTLLPNIGKTLAKKLLKIGVLNKQELIDVGSESAFIQIATLEESGSCINMLYALEGAIQGIRWHSLSKDRKIYLKEFYNSISKDFK